MRRRTLAPLILLAAAGSCGCAEGSPRPDTHVPSRAGDTTNARDAAERPSTGRLHVPLGARVVLQGLLIMGPTKGLEDGTNIRVQRIDGRGTQERIRLKLANDNPAGIHWEEHRDGYGYEYPYVGQSYEIEGYEDGRFEGLTDDDLRRGVAVQLPRRFFKPYFVALRAKRIEPIVLTPADFVGRPMLAEGVALTSGGQALVTGIGWMLTQGQVARWPADVEGKLVQTYGAIGRAASGNLVVNGPWRLVRLEDQVGRSVELRGMAGLINGRWEFRYRGVELYLDGIEPSPKLSEEIWGHPVEVRGRLERAMLPPDPAMQFIVRDAVLSRTGELLDPEVPATEE